MPKSKTADPMEELQAQAQELDMGYGKPKTAKEPTMQHDQEATQQTRACEKCGNTEWQKKGRFVFCSECGNWHTKSWRMYDR